MALLIIVGRFSAAAFVFGFRVGVRIIAWISLLVHALQLLLNEYVLKDAVAAWRALFLLRLNMILNITMIGFACLARQILIDGWPLGPHELRSIVARGRYARRWHRLSIWCIISFSVVVVL